jgi:dihydropteroate synthase
VAGTGFRPVTWRVRDRTLSNADHTLVMGVVNVTPDSFSDGGRWFDTSAAVRHGMAMIAAGADLIDVGGESTRPGAEAVEAADELRRVLPVVEALAGAGAVVSIDTSKAVVAESALAAGAAVVNDVTALGDRDMAGVVAEAEAGVVLMHMQGTPRTMQEDPHYDDVVAEVRDHLTSRAARAADAGVGRDRICIDPGIGFGKNLEHNLELLRRLPALTDTGYPVLVGASRKSFLAGILGDLPVRERDVPTVAAHVLAIAGGAAVIRVHEVVGGLRSARVADAIVR